MANLQQSVILLGDQLVSLQKTVGTKMWLKLYFLLCKCAFKYNKTQFNWIKLNKVLNQDNNNISVKYSRSTTR